jgi:hypothetical protein
MTDWIDTLAANVSPDMQRRNADAAAQAARAEMIATQAPIFFRAVTFSASVLVSELNAKLGAAIGRVTMTPSDGGFSIRNDGPVSVTVNARLQVKEARIKVMTDKKASHALAYGNVENESSFAIGIDDAGGIYTTGPGVDARVTDPAELASTILQAAFTPDVVATR